MNEKDARAVGAALDMLDELADLKKELSKGKREFHICAEDDKECLHGSMNLPAELGIVFCTGIIGSIKKDLAEKYNVHLDAANDGNQ